MKNLFKSALKYSIVIYFFINIIFTIFNYCEYSNILQNNFVVNQNMHQEVINLQEGVSIDQMIENKYYVGKVSILSKNLSIFILSILLGFLLSSIKYSKESSILKYILIFILGNFIFVTFVEIFMYIFKVVNISQNFFDIYREILKNTFLIYCFIFFIITFINQKIYELIVKKINKMLPSTSKKLK